MQSLSMIAVMFRWQEVRRAKEISKVNRGVTVMGGVDDLSSTYFRSAAYAGHDRSILPMNRGETGNLGRPTLSKNNGMRQ